MTERLLLVVPLMPEYGGQHPGGQITAARGLLEHLKANGTRPLLINTAESSFPPPSSWRRAIRGISRVLRAALMLIFHRPDGTIAFASASPGLIEKAMICLLSRAVGVRSVLFLRSTYSSTPSGFALWLTRFSLRSPSVLVVQGQAAHDQAIDLGAASERVAVIPNWLPPGIKVADTPKSCRPSEPLHFLFSGWLVEAKGVREIAEAITSLQLGGYRFSFTIAGGGTLEQWLRDTARENAWGLGVKITGWVDFAAMKQLLEDGHVFVLPTSHGEGFPNAVLEAMAYGMPVISTRAGALADSVQNNQNGILIPARDPSALEHAMRRYINAPDEVQRQSRVALEVVRRRHDPTLNCQAAYRLLHSAPPKFNS